MANVKRYIKIGKPQKTFQIVENAKRRLNRHIKFHPKDENARKYLISLR